MTRNTSVSKLFGVLLIFVLLFSALPMGEANAATVFIETFDNGSQFTTSTPFFSDGYGDYFGLTDGTTGDFGSGAFPASLKSYSGFTGNFLTGMDLDGEGASLPITVNWTGINISGISSLAFSGDFAEFVDDVGDIDAPDFILVEYQIDGGGYQNLIAFQLDEDETDTYNGVFREDTDFNGTGDGIALGRAAQTFVKAIAGSGTILDLRLTVSVSSGDEDFAVDNFSIGESVAPTPVIVINEIMQNPDVVYDSDGEWFELYNPTTSPIDIDGWTMMDNDSDSHMIANGAPLVIPAGGYLVLGNNIDAGTNGGVSVAYQYPSFYLSNSSDELVLLDTDLTEIDRVEWDGGVAFPDPTGASMALSDPTLDNNVGANWCTSSTPYGGGDLGTPGSANNCPPPSIAIPIYDIQYTTDLSGDSPYKDQSDIATEGIVTALFYNGYHIEDPAGGAWNGLFVYDSNSPAIGDLVRVMGTVSEYYGLTQLKNLTGYELVSSGNAIPAPVVLASGDVAQEQWEGVLVRVENATITNDSLGHGEWSVNDGSGEVVVGDKGDYTYSPANGDALIYLVGVLDYSYGAFKMQPRTDADIKLSACGNAYTPIYTIQGDGFSSPLDGTLVDVEGVVTGDFQDGKSGFTLQDAVGDGNSATSDGVFVYAPSPDVNVGDHVRVTGYVDEYYGLTEITGVSDLEVCSTGNAVAATPISLPVMDMSDLEVYEGMLITFPQSLYISEYYNFARYGELVLSTDRQFQPTATFDPGLVDAAQMLADSLLNRIKLDDGRGSQNSDPALHPNGSIFDMANLFRGGDILNNLTGIVDYNYGEYKIQPTVGADYVNANPRTAQPDAVGGNLTVASFNVLNYFTTLDDGTNDICGPAGDMECRGADTVEEFTRQRAKIIAALASIDADVVGLIEIENNEFEAVADLVAGLNDAVGAGTYGYVDTGYIGGDAIKVAFIYKTATVSLVGDYAILDESVDSRFIDAKNRPALAQTFMDNATGGIFTPVVNHLKSKGSSCDSLGDPDLGDGAGNCNLTRTAAAEALVDWLATDPTNSGDADFLIMGDLNSYDKEDPIDAILAGGYSDLVYQFLGENAYSYVYNGQLGYLDHALANGDLTPEISGVTIWHINADEASLIDYDMSYKKAAQDALYAPDAYRSSDHDPVVIGMNVCDEIAPAIDISLSVDVLWPANHKYVDVTATVLATDNFDIAPTVTLLSVTSSEADEGLGDGDFPDDIVIVDDYTFQLRAERDATAKDGRTYTITYQVTDACGNSTIGTATVFVPFSQKK